MGSDKDINFLYELGSLRNIQRTWRQFFNGSFANVAEHTLRVTWIALMIAKDEKADISKTIKLALVHDMTETRTGDVNYLSRMYTKRDEDQAIKDIFDNTSLEEFKELWHEAHAKKTKESQIVKDADTLDVDLEIMEQRARGTDLDFWDKTREAAHKRLYTDTAKDMAKKIRSSDTHDWYLNTRNRLTKGDWKE